MLNNFKVEDSFIQTGYSNWKNAKSANKRFQKNESLKCHQTAIQRLVEISKTTQDIPTTLKNNLTETQCENRTSLLKILSCLRYLSGQGLPCRGHGDDKNLTLTPPKFSWGRRSYIRRMVEKKESSLHFP